MHTNNINYVGPNEVHSDDIPSIMFLIYARQNKARMWLNYGRTDNKDIAFRQMNNLLRDFRNTVTMPGVDRNFTVKVVTVYKNDYLDIPVSLDKNINWYSAHMIPLWEICENPDQTIHNGGN